MYQLRLRVARATLFSHIFSSLGFRPNSQIFSEPVFLDRFFCGGAGREELVPVKWVGTKYGIESAMLYKMLLFKKHKSIFHPPPTSAILFAWWKWILGVSFPTHTTYDDENSEIFNSFTWNRCLQESVRQKNWFLTRNWFRGIEAWGFYKFKSTGTVERLPSRYKHEIITEPRL